MITATSATTPPTIAPTGVELPLLFLAGVEVSVGPDPLWFPAAADVSVVLDGGCVLDALPADDVEEASVFVAVGSAAPVADTTT